MGGYFILATENVTKAAVHLQDKNNVPSQAVVAHFLNASTP